MLTQIFYFSLSLQVLLLAAQYNSEASSSLICIGVDKDEQHLLCENQMCNISSLETLPPLLQGNVRPYYILFCTTQIELENSVQFEQLHTINFIGNKRKTIINCTEQAGITFTNSEEIYLENLTFEKCGALHNSTSINFVTNNSTLHLYSSIYLFNSTNFSMAFVDIRNSNGLGLALFDIDGLVNISYCAFENNGIVNQASYGGGGMYVEFTYCPPGIYDDNCIRYNMTKTKKTRYIISNTNFTNNKASHGNRDLYINYNSRFYGFGRGGGLQVTFKGYSLGNSILVCKCNFSDNTAVWGGGLKASFQDRSSNNTLSVVNCTFHRNKCFQNGGGGANVGYTFYNQPFLRNNKILFANSEFIENEAKFGGGLAFYSSDSISSELNNMVEFNNCTWKGNKASYGSAVSMSVHAWTTYLSGNLPTPVFTDSRFIENIIVNKCYSKTCKEGAYTTYSNGTGAFFATRYTLVFKELLVFMDNNGSAMYLTSSVMKIAPHTMVYFKGNSGFSGGGVALIAFSVIVLGDNSKLIFENNRAVDCGGAIYSYSIDKHDYLSSRSCFLQHEHTAESSEKHYNVSVEFLHNIVGEENITTRPCGHSIYAVTLLPCLYYCKQNTNDTIAMEDVLTCVGNITFNEGTVRDYEISTSGAHFKYDIDNFSNFSMIPGKETFLPIDISDDLNQKVQAKYHLSIFNKENSQIKADEAYTYLSRNRTELYGKPGDSANLLLSKTGFRGLAIRFNVHMEHCPPGYILVNDPQFDLNLSRCVCSVGTNQSYGGIYYCNESNFTATVQHGYWIGYVDSETEEHLFFGYCPNRYCFQTEERKRSHILPAHASREMLDMCVCGDTRTGVLCGMCRNGYSALYHSSRPILCYKSQKCKFGWLLYIVSELLPLTLMFTVIVAFNISFASGELNGFIFFAQVFDLLSVTGNGFIWFPMPAFEALRVIRSIYKFLNFDFFNVNKLSFCLWERATVLDMIIFKFVTVVYALMLIVLTIWLMNKCDVYKRLYCLRVSTVKTSFTHGISAFLVMVYTQCTITSFKLLDFTAIYSKGHIVQQYVVTYQGNLIYFCEKHRPYAIPAIFCLIVMTAFPIIILTLYPSIFKIISFLKLEETRCLSWMVQKIPHSYIKPFADSFQSSFKDEMRFFAGFYFAYRLVILIGWFAPNRLTQSYMLLELILVTILVIHAIAQPYNSKKHNILDALFFFNLAVINGITVYNYQYARGDEYDRYGVDAFVYIQIVLVYLPLAYFLIYVTISCIRKVNDFHKLNTSKKALSLQLKEIMNTESEYELPSRLDEDNDDILETSDHVVDYELFEKQPNYY